jgi:divalent anion:Na+ symporter, DASS family
MTITVSMWIFGLGNIFVPSLFIVLAMIVLGLVPESVALSGFASDGLFMAMSILGLSALLVSSGLTYRFLLYALKISPGNQFFYNLNLILSGILLSTVVPSINGRAVLIAPFLRDMVEVLKSRPLGRASNLMAVSAFTGASLFSPIFLSSKSVNFVVYGLLPEQMQNAFEWVGWLVAASMTGIIMLVAYVLLASLFFGNRERLPISKILLAEQLAMLGPISSREWAAIIGIISFGVGVIASPIIHISPPWISFILFFGLLLSGALKPEEFKHDIDWPFLIFMAGVVGMVNGMRHLELDTWMAQKFTWMGAYMVDDFPLFILMLTGALTLVRVVVPISAAIVTFAAVFNSIALVEGVNPWIVGFIILTLGENWYAPYQCSYYIQFRDILRDPPLYDEKRFLLFNALMTVVKLGAIYASIPFWKYLGLM